MGGLGLFLLGMVIMTEGLRGIAGNLLHRTLTHFTRSPFSGVVAGTASTAILQSSSATTVAAVGFVGAGLLTFPQALGIVYGANIGTTVTGWLVVLIGFKLKLGTIMMPLILLGVLLRLFGKGRTSSAGLALAGFGLIFVGIAALQAGMEGLEGIISPGDFPRDTMIGRLQLIFIGVAITVITQSSSAGIAAALAALHTGTILLPQAAALVIGMNIGTTVTALLATIGGSLEARRTGYSHVIYNLIISAGAFFFLTPYLHIWEYILPGYIHANAEVPLVAFHSLFNVMGAVVFLPFTRMFAHLVERLVPVRDYGLARHLDAALLTEQAVALIAARQALNSEIISLLKHVTKLLSGKKKRGSGFLHKFRRELDKTKQYIGQIHLAPDDGPAWDALLECMHTIDHMSRLYDRCDEDSEKVQMVIGDPVLVERGQHLLAGLNKCIKAFRHGEWEIACDSARQAAVSFNEDKDHLRDTVMRKVANGMLTVEEGNQQLESARWLRRVAQHMNSVLCHAQSMNEILPEEDEKNNHDED